MIQPPRRSVTRFFIPLIDVLTLLFCIFLLMPFVKATGDGEGDPTADPSIPDVPKVDPATVNAADLAKRLEALQRDLDRLRKEKGETLQRLEIKTLEIDKDTGELYYYAPERVPIRTQGDAVALMNRHRDEVRQAGGRELYYLFLFPRERDARFPTQRQMNSYRRWFEGVPFGIDNPQAGH